MPPEMRIWRRISATLPSTSSSVSANTATPSTFFPWISGEATIACGPTGVEAVTVTGRRAVTASTANEVTSASSIPPSGAESLVGESAGGFSSIWLKMSTSALAAADRALTRESVNGFLPPAKVAASPCSPPT
jgi:hypothetical protein